MTPQLYVIGFAYSFLFAILDLLYGGWETQLTTLVIFIVADFIVAITGVFISKSKIKFSSKKFTTGFIKKIYLMLIVAISYRIDIYTGNNFLKNGTIMFFIFSETISILKNIGKSGVKIPKILENFLSDAFKEETKNGD